QAYDTCVALRPDYALTYAERGQALIREIPGTQDADQRRELERRGLDDLNRARTLEPGEPHIHWLRGVALSHLARVSEAFDAFAVRGAVHLEQKQLDHALADFRRALVSNPNHYFPSAGIAKSYLALDRLEESLAAFDHLLSIAVTDWQRVEAHLGRARSLSRLGRTEEARRAQENARQIDPRTAASRR